MAILLGNIIALFGSRRIACMLEIGPTCVAQSHRPRARGITGIRDGMLDGRPAEGDDDDDEYWINSLSPAPRGVRAGTWYQP